MNPDLIDGIANPRNPAAMVNANKAQRVEAIVQKLDPHKIIYHHSSGNLSSLHTSNFYPNWVPIQEMCDWFEHWSTKGVKPLFTCEFGSPFTWDWVIYRGWYKGKREFGGAIVPWEFCLAEWNAQFLGDQAFRISEMEKENLRWEAGKFRAGEVWSRNQYPYNLDNRLLEERNPVFSMHIADQWRAFRTWEVSANSPWHFAPYWKLKEGVDKSPKDLVIDWENLQKPGLSPDVITNRRERIDLGYERSDWINTVASEALINNNKPLLAYIGGMASAFTSKDHNYLPGETVEKQIIIINNSRQHVDIESKWSINLPGNMPALNHITLKTGQQERIPVRISLPENLTPGKYEINASVNFSNGEVQADSFTIHVLHRPQLIRPEVSIALWDPAGETGKLLDSLNIDYQRVDAGADLDLFNLLIIGKAAMTVDEPGLDLARVRNGLKVIVFEQTPEVLERRMGFRIQQYGLRNVYRRVPNHPVLSGLNEDNLSNWRGDATSIPTRLNLEMSEKYRSPSTRWCDIEVTRIWRCGNRGSVASVLIEKPAAGNFLPLIDGGYSLQYSPLMEYREGSGVVLFCQMDVTGRTESEPAAEILARNMISYVSYWEPRASRLAYYAGSASGKAHLERSSVILEDYEGGNLRPMDILIVDPEGSSKLADSQKSISKWLKKGGRMLTIGLNKEDFGGLFPDLEMKKEEHISAYFESQGVGSLLAGIGPADIHNRAPLEVSKVTLGAKVFGDGVLAVTENNQAVLCQLVPWHLDYSKEQHNVKQTFRRTSFLVSRLLGNLDVPGSTKVLDRFNSPADPVNDKRWLEGLYLDEPEEWDDPYRFFRW
jgi:hypothetical protein